MQVRLLDADVAVREPDAPDAAPLAILARGTIVDLGAVIKKDGRKWVRVTLPDGRRGLLASDARVYTLRDATLLAKTVDVRSRPGEYAELVRTLRKGARFKLTEQVDTDGVAWVRVQDKADLDGYILGSTKVRCAAVVAGRTGAQNMTYGALWCIGGTIVTVLGYQFAASSPGGGSYMIFWGAILFGGLQFLKGVGQVLTGN
jgi:hypothetical protein